MPARTPTIIQMQRPDNGVIALSIVMAYLGRHEPTWRLRKSAHTDAAGTSMEGIAACAQSFGLTTATAESTADELKNETHPLIAGWTNGQFVVIEGHGRSGWYINDPAKGRRLVSDDEFEDRFDGCSIRFERGPDFKRGGKPSSIRRSLRRAMEGCSSAITAGVVASTAAVPLRLAQAGLITYFVDVLLVVRRPDLIPPFLLTAGAIFLLLAMLGFIQSQSLTRMSFAIAIQLKIRLLGHAVRLPESERHLRSPADIQQRLSVARWASNSSIKPLVLLPANLLSILIFGTAVVLVSAPVAIGLAISIGFGFLIARIINGRIFSLNTRSQILMGMQRSTAYAGLSARTWLLESGGLRRLIDSWLGFTVAGRNLAQEQGGVQVVAQTGRGLINQLVTQVATLVIGGLQVINGSITLGELAALQFLVGSFATAASAILGVVQGYPVLRSCFARIDDILDVPISEESIVRGKEGNRALAISGVAVDDDRVLEGAVPAGSLVVIRDLDQVAIDRAATGIAAAWRSTVGDVRVTTGRIDRFPGTMIENLTGFDPRISYATVSDMIEFIGLGTKVRRLEGGISEKIREDLPFGDDDEESRLEMASVLLDPPTLMIARNGLSELPPAEAREMLDRLRSHGTAVIVLDPEFGQPEDAVVITPRPRDEVSA